MDYIFRVPEDYQHEGVRDFNHMPTENVLSSDGELPVLGCSCVGSFVFLFFGGGLLVGGCRPCLVDAYTCDAYCAKCGARHNFYDQIARHTCGKTWQEIVCLT